MSPIHLVIFSLYVLSSVGYLAVFRGRAPALGRNAQPLMLAGMSLHMAYLVARGFAVGMLPMTTLPDALTTIAFAMAAVYAYLEIQEGTPMTGLFVLPFIAVITLIGGVDLRALPPPPLVMLRSPWFALHTLSAVTSYCAFAIAAIYGVLYLLLYHELKLGRFSLLYHRLPPLEKLGRMSLRSLVTGLALLTVAILIGMFWLSRLKPGYLDDPKVLWTLLTWCVFGSSLLAHYRWTSAGPVSVYLTLTGFGMLLISMLLPGHLAASFHQFP